MKKSFFLFVVMLFLSLAVSAQNSNSSTTTTSNNTNTNTNSNSNSKTGETKKRPPIFRATKDQIIALQKVLTADKVFTGEANGERSAALTAAVKKYQEANSLKVTGGINGATLQKAGIALSDKQKEQVAAQAAYDAAKAQKN